MQEMQETSSIPELGSSLGEGNGNPLQYSCQGNSMDRGAWQATVHEVAKSWSAAAAAAVAAKLLQSCPTLCNPIDGSPPGSPVPRILQARTLEWVKTEILSSKKEIIPGSAAPDHQLNG